MIIKNFSIKNTNDEEDGHFFIPAGCAVAAGISYAINHSFWWALLHLFLGWAYIAYIFTLTIMENSSRIFS